MSYASSKQWQADALLGRAVREGKKVMFQADGEIFIAERQIAEPVKPQPETRWFITDEVYGSPNDPT